MICETKKFRNVQGIRWFVFFTIKYGYTSEQYWSVLWEVNTLYQSFSGNLLLSWREKFQKIANNQNEIMVENDQKIQGYCNNQYYIRITTP